MPARTTAIAATRIPDKAVHQQLNRVIGGKVFSRVDRLKRFISFIVQEAIAGHAGDLKEYVIGVQVFGKETSFDPRTDPIVRVQARRLRARLFKYYAEEGQHDEIIIDLPKGGYAPVFKRRETGTVQKPSLSATLISKNTIAVMPFADLSANGSLSPFCRGLQDEIIHALTRNKTLRVLSKRQGAAGAEAAIVIDGSVRVFGDTLRVTAQIIDGVSGYYLWSETIEGKSANMLPTQESIAKLIIERLQPELVDSSEHSSGRRVGDNLAASNLYIQGRYHLNQRTEEGLNKAVEFFERAIVEDAQFSLAHSGLADAFSLLAHYGVLNPADVWGKAAASASTAVMLDSRSAEAHTSLAHVSVTQDWDWFAAEREFLRAIQLNARYATAHHWYATSCLVPTGRLDEALDQLMLAQSLDPVSPIIAKDVAMIYYWRREFEAALDQCDHTIELNPHFAPAYLTLGLIQEQRKDFDESAAAFRRAVDLSPNTPRMHGAMARTFALSGKTDRARETLKMLYTLSKSRYVSPFEFLTIYAALGDANRTYRWLSKVCDDRCWEVLSIKVDPRFESLKADPRFLTTMRRVHLS